VHVQRDSVPTYSFQEQEAQYSLLLALQQDLLTKIKDGISARDAYQAALSYVKEKSPELEKHFQKNIGFGVSFFLYR
jgi:nucleosome binding factor SPN SPT16 subunit